MNYIKRAFFSSTRRWVKTLILIAVFSVIAALMFSGICISNAAQQLVAQAKSTVGSEVTISWNSDSIPNVDGVINPVLMTSKQLASLSSQPHVKDYNIITSSIDGVSDGFSVMGSESRTQQHQEEGRKSFADEGKTQFSKTFLEPNLTIYGVRKSALCDQFVSGGYKLVSGRTLTEKDFEKNVVLLSKPVADKNKLKVGETIRLNDSFRQAHYRFTIVGIFTTPKPASEITSECSELTPYNDVFMPFTQVGLFDISFKYQPYSLDKNVMTANFYLDDPGHVSSFVSYTKKLLGSNYKVQTNDDLYKAAVQPLCGVASAAQLLTVFTLLAGGLIFALIIVFSMRGRSHEFGVLLAVGEKRIRILLQMFLEVLLPVCIAFCIGSASGNYLSGKIGNSMLSQKASVVQQQQNGIYLSQFNGVQHIVNGLVGKSKIVSPIDKIDMSVPAVDYGLLAAACLLLALASVIVPCISVLRYQPRQILQQK